MEKIDGRRGFRVLPHTADKSIEAWGDTLSELFLAAAEGMFNLTQDLSSIKQEYEWVIEVAADSPEDLLHAWLAELLWVAERDEATPCAFEVEALDEQSWSLTGRAWGGSASPETRRGAAVKAVTYHDLKVKREKDVWRVRVVFDV